MTGNFGTDENAKESLGFAEQKKRDPFYECQDRLIAYCKDRYGSEFVNRIDEFVPFMPLQDNDLQEIIKMRLEEVISRISNRNCRLLFHDNVYDLLIKMSKNEHGKNAMVLNRIITKKIEPCVSDALMSLGQDFYSITIVVEDDAFSYKIEKEEKTK
jgi:ATP-dependent Clp protease ATP-binding subunit ClpA